MRGSMGWRLPGAAQGDHLLLTPDVNTSDGNLSYFVEYDQFTSRGVLAVCNPTAGAIDDGTTNFNLMVFEPQ